MLNCNVSEEDPAEKNSIDQHQNTTSAGGHQYMLCFGAVFFQQWRLNANVSCWPTEVKYVVLA